MANEVARLSGRLRLDTHNLQFGGQRAAEFGIDPVPPLCVIGRANRGLRFYGICAVLEFTSLLTAIEMTGRGDSGLKPSHGPGWPGSGTRSKSASSSS